MHNRPGEHRIHPGWWTLILAVAISLFLFITATLFLGTFKSYIPVTVISDRSGLVMESGAKVKLRGLQVGRVSGVSGGRAVQLQLQLDPDQIRYIPANVTAQIRATTVFGAKFVDLVYPDAPAGGTLSAGSTIPSTNVSTEVNTLFENVVGVLEKVDPAKLNAILTAVADGVRGRGEAMGQAITDSSEITVALNNRSTALGDNWRAIKGAGDTYERVVDDLVNILDAASVTSTTVVGQQDALDALLLNVIGLAHAGTELLATNGRPIVDAVGAVQPTTALLLEYQPSYTCTLEGAKWALDHGGLHGGGGNGKSTLLDLGFTWTTDQYRYPENLPITAAKGGPGGRPGCGSLPDVAKNFPVPYLVTNTGFGTGLDMRPNPGLPHPWWVNFFPVTRAVPEPPSLRGMGPPAIGPVPYPGAPPYGAPLYGPDGTPLYPPPPGAPPPPPPPPPPAPAPNEPSIGTP